MKIKVFILPLFVLISHYAFSQNMVADTNVLNKTVFLQFHTSAFWGKDFGGNNFFATSYGLDYARRVNNKTTFFVGADMINTDAKYRDLAPRKNKTSAEAQIGLSHKFNDRLTVSGSVFYNSFYNSIGADLDVTYMFGEDSFINFYASFYSIDDAWKVRDF